MSGPTPEEADEGLEDEEEEEDQEPPGEPIEVLLARAKDYRAGTPDVPRDMARCYATYLRAAERGSAEAEYAVALFHLTGGVVSQDLKEGARRLRIAADGGSLHAKVYLGNLYELGTHFTKDREKADVWYRSAARAAGVAQDAADLPKAMAELGCVRYVLMLDADPSVAAPERARLLKKARAFGHELRIRGTARASALPASPESLAATDAALAAAPTPAPDPLPLPLPLPDPAATKTKPKEANPKPKQTKPTPKEAKPAKEAKPPRAEARGPERAPVPWGLAFSAFLYAAIFMAAALGAAYLAANGARHVVEGGGTLPVFGPHVERVFPTVLGVLGVLPSLLVYRFGAVARAIVAAGITFAAGLFLWSRIPLVELRMTQATACGICGFLGALLILGLMGGAKPRGKA